MRRAASPATVPAFRWIIGREVSLMDLALYILAFVVRALICESRERGALYLTFQKLLRTLIFTIQLISLVVPTKRPLTPL
jgi:hypothetical protein